MREDMCILLAARKVSSALKWIEDRRENLMSAAPSVANVLRPRGDYAIIGPGGGVDVHKDLVPVINVAETLEVLVVGPAFKGRTLADLVNEAKARPGEVSYGTYGLGSKAHIDAEAFAKTAGVKLMHVPYKGVADVVPALIGSQVQIAFTGVPPVVQVVKGGQLRAIAVAAPKRSAVLPEVPTFAEVGMPGFQSSAWFGLVAPAGTPRAVIDKVAGDVSRIIVKPDFQARYITGVGLELLNQGPDQFAEFLNRDRATYANYIRDLGVKLD